MGCYVNPPDESKESWLAKNGTVLVNVPRYEDIPAGQMLVVLKRNPNFSAAGVIFDRREYEEFTRNDDPRPTQLFLVDTEKLLAVAPDLAWRLN